MMIVKLSEEFSHEEFFREPLHFIQQSEGVS
jgi:hypothetical protein